MQKVHQLMRSLVTSLWTRLSDDLLERVRFGVVSLGVLFVLMTAPMVPLGDGPLWLQLAVLAAFIVIIRRWIAWLRGSRPTILDLINEVVVVGTTAYIVGDPFIAVTAVYAVACVTPLFVSLRRLALSLVLYSVAFLGGLLLATREVGTLLNPEVLIQPPTVAFTGVIIYFYWNSLCSQQQLLDQRAQIVEQLSVSEHRFRSVVETLPGAILTTSPQQGIVYASPQLKGLLGYHLRDLEGDLYEVLERIIHPEELSGFSAAVRQASESSVPFSFECRAITESGETIWISVESVPVSDEQSDDPVWQSLIIDVTDRHLLTAKLAHQAFHDALTGLPNRMLFDDRVDQALRRARRHPGSTAVCFIDLDNFKVVNDSLGHRYGDLLIIEVGRRLVECVRDEDTVARLGGDEFALLLEALPNQNEVIRVVDRAIQALAQPYNVDGQPVYTSASAGVAFVDDEELTSDELIRRADVAMYEAKRLGKGRLMVFERQMGAYARKRMNLEVELREALERNEFRVVYQPIVELDTGRIHEVEALIRWEHPTRGLLSPAEFLQTAEDTGLIVPIGRWVLNQACQQARTWQLQEPGAASLRLSVNLSPRQLHDEHLADDIAQALADSGLDPSLLQLEVAESAMLADIEQATQAIHHLTSLGVMIAIDDFGTGNSSLGHLRRLPVNTLKIDRSYVQELGRSEQGTTMLRAMVTLGKTLGMAVTAEGIETIEQTGLRAFGCDFGQGYYFARPLSGEDMSSVLAHDQPYPIIENKRLKLIFSDNDDLTRAAL